MDNRNIVVRGREKLKVYFFIFTAAVTDRRRPKTFEYKYLINIRYYANNFVHVISKEKKIYKRVQIVSVPIRRK